MINVKSLLTLSPFFNPFLSVFSNSGSKNGGFPLEIFSHFFLSTSIPKTLKFFDAFYTSEYGFEDYICIPITQFGKLRFIEGRNRFNNDKPKYYRQPTNAQISDVLFPIDKVKNKKKKS